MTKTEEKETANETKTTEVSAGWTLFSFFLLGMSGVSYAFGFDQSVTSYLAPDITLARPFALHFLWFIPAVAILIQQLHQRRLQKLQKTLSAHLLERLTPSLNPTRRRFKGILLAFGWVMLLFTLAGPQWGTHVRILKKKGIDIIVAIDLSESMLAKDISTASLQHKQRRLQLARKKVRVLMDLLAGERIGIIAFAGRPVTLCPLTIDHNTCAAWLDSFDPSLIAQGGTAIASTIKHSIPMFSTSGSNSRALFMLTDGDDHEKNTIKAAKLAKEKGIRIYALGFGSPKMTTITPDQLPPPPKGQPVDPRPIRTRLNEALLKKITALTQGIYRRAEVSHRDIRALYDHAKQTLQAQTHKSQRMIFREERFNVFTGIGLILLLFTWSLGERKD